MSYRFLKITSFYTSFLDYYYKNNPPIIDKCYDTQYKHLMLQGYAWANYFQIHLNNLGNEAFEIIHNAPILQSAWAKEHFIRANTIL